MKFGQMKIPHGLTLEENKVAEILLKHMGTINSFIDEKGNNHFHQAVKEIVAHLNYSKDPKKQ